MKSPTGQQEQASGRIRDFKCRRLLQRVGRVRRMSGTLSHCPTVPLSAGRLLGFTTELQVDEGLSRLRSREGGLTAAAMSHIGQDELADILRHVHWNKVRWLYTVYKGYSRRMLCFVYLLCTLFWPSPFQQTLRRPRVLGFCSLHRSFKET